MGREYRTISVTCSVSRHNSEQDDLDEAAYDHMREAIEQLVKHSHYQDISPMVDGW